MALIEFRRVFVQPLALPQPPAVDVHYGIHKYAVEAFDTSTVVEEFVTHIYIYIFSGALCVFNGFAAQYLVREMSFLEKNIVRDSFFFSFLLF